MKLELLFIIRFGLTNDHGFLSRTGEEQIQKLGRFLAAEYGLQARPENSIGVLCSTGQVTVSTAQCIVESAAIKTIPGSYPELCSSATTCDTENALALIKNHAEKHQILIVITHQQMAQALPVQFCLKVLDTNSAPHFHLNHGEGSVIDCRRKTCEQLKC